MLKLSSSRGFRIDIPVLSVSWSFEDHAVIIQALRKGLIEHEASDTGGVPRWKSSCSDRLAEATGLLRGEMTASGVNGVTAVVVYVEGGVGEGRASEEARRQGSLSLVRPIL